MGADVMMPTISPKKNGSTPLLGSAALVVRGPAVRIAIHCRIRAAAPLGGPGGPPGRYRKTAGRERPEENGRQILVAVGASEAVAAAFGGG